MTSNVKCFLSYYQFCVRDFVISKPQPSHMDDRLNISVVIITIRLSGIFNTLSCLLLEINERSPDIFPFSNKFLPKTKD